jgi:hypothetical protein
MYLYNKSGSRQYLAISTNNRTLNVILYDDALSGINYNSEEFVFSTSSTYNDFFDIFESSNAKSGVIKISRYSTGLNIDTINLNQTISTKVAWVSSDINIDYTGDTVVILDLYDSNNNFIKNFGEITYNTTLTNSQFNGLQSGTYYFNYKFVGNINVNFSKGKNKSFDTNTFSFITQYIQSIDASAVLPTSSSVIITANFGNGYISNTYRLSINDVTIDSTFPYTYNLPSVINTTTYTASVTECISDSADTGRPSTTFIVYKYPYRYTKSNTHQNMYTVSFVYHYLFCICTCISLFNKYFFIPEVYIYTL